MPTILGTILAFVLVFGILVFIHEFGHFFTAKLVGIRVEVFSFGYGKRLFGFKKGDTDYRVSLIPMGGYCRFLGEGLYDKERPIAPDDFAAKSRPARFAVMAMGSVMNLILALVLLAVVNMGGVTVPIYQEQAPVIGWIEDGSPAAAADLRVDDEILTINGRPVATWADVELAVGSKPERTLTVEVRRGGAVLPVRLRTEKRTRYEMGYAGFYGKILTQAQMIAPGSPAAKAGLQPGDVFVSIDGEPVFFYTFVKTIEKSPDRELVVGIERAGRPLTVRVTPRREGDVGKIGVPVAAQSVLRRFGVFGALAESWRENKRLAFVLFRFIGDLFTGEASARQLGGPLEIANFSYTALRMGVMPLLSWIAFISLQLGILNLFPIPVFDGGQIFVLLVEGLTRRDLSPRLRAIWMQIGFVIFIALIGFVVLNDVVKRLPSGWGSLVPW
ncbi:MAG: RIP metalloprotease RseP [Candidatus Aminicenantes bacterium]|nr:RIP metalloprotease RseP [Candidatus Aminicenantes bacterium]